MVSDVYNNPRLTEPNIFRQKSRKIGGVFRSRTIGTSKLVECQIQLNKRKLKLKQEMSTRWNLTFLMFQRLIEAKDALIMSMSYVNCSKILTAEKWVFLEDCVPLLEPLHELTEDMSGEQYATSFFPIFPK